MIEFLVGSILAICVGMMASKSRLDLDRAFYPTVLMVIASYYVLFAAMAGQYTVLVAQSAVMAIFVAASIKGFRGSLWLLVFMFAAHGVFDIVHKLLIHNPGVPSWWPNFCLAFDLFSALYLSYRLSTGLAYNRSEVGD